MQAADFREKGSLIGRSGRTVKCSQIFAGFFYVLPRQFCSFSVDGQQDGAKILAFAEEIRKAAAVVVRAGGVAVGVVADESLVCVVQRHEVRAEAVFIPPVVEQDAGVRVFCRLVEAFGVHDDLHGEAPLPEAHRRPPEGGAGVAVDQGQLPFVVADQRRDVRFVPQNLQGVPGGDPSAAHVRRGTQAVAVLLFGNVVLIVDKIVHSCCSITGCSAM